MYTVKPLIIPHCSPCRREFGGDITGSFGEFDSIPDGRRKFAKLRQTSCANYITGISAGQETTQHRAVFLSLDAPEELWKFSRKRKVRTEKCCRRAVERQGEIRFSSGKVCSELLRNNERTTVYEQSARNYWNTC